ncbi:histone-fold-containing protein [Chytridium lagenaria]|nr:histone-fold-containing protein [Chytridium lagenaria]
MATIDDLGMPKAITARVIKTALPPQGQCNKDAKSAMTRACTVFISYITASANDCAKSGNHKTISSANIYDALRSNGFEEFIPKLKKEMEAYNLHIEGTQVFKAEKC